VFSNILGIIKFIQALYQFILWALGQISRAQYVASLERIDEAAGRAGNPDLPPAKRLEGGKSLEDEINKRA